MVCCVLSAGEAVKEALRQHIGQAELRCEVKALPGVSCTSFVHDLQKRQGGAKAGPKAGKSDPP